MSGDIPHNSRALPNTPNTTGGCVELSSQSLGPQVPTIKDVWDLAQNGIVDEVQYWVEALGDAVIAPAERCAILAEVYSREASWQLEKVHYLRSVDRDDPSWYSAAAHATECEQEANRYLAIAERYRAEGAMLQAEDMPSSAQRDR